MTEAQPTTTPTKPNAVVVESISGNARLAIDFANEAHYMELQPGASRLDTTYMALQMACWGLEVMPEDECPVEVYEDGRRRFWLAERASA